MISNSDNSSSAFASPTPDLLYESLISAAKSLNRYPSSLDDALDADLIATARRLSPNGYSLDEITGEVHRLANSAGQPLPDALAAVRLWLDAPTSTEGRTP